MVLSNVKMLQQCNKIYKHVLQTVLCPVIKGLLVSTAFKLSYSYFNSQDDRL